VEKKVIFTGNLMIESTILPLSINNIFKSCLIAEMAQPNPAGPAPTITISYFGIHQVPEFYIKLYGQGILLIYGFKK
jgi:hypothetical protein